MMQAKFTNCKVGFLALVFLLAFLLPEKAVASPQEYDVTWTPTNLYSNYSLTYNLSNLSVDSSYEFYLQQMDGISGTTVVQTLQTIYVDFATQATIIFTPPFPSGSYPIRVTDNYGQILGKHYVTPAPDVTWGASNGENPEYLKTGIGNVVQVPCPTSPVCSYHHSNNQLYVTTGYGGWTYLHYRVADATPITEYIQIADIGSSEVVAQFSVEELVNFQKNGTGARTSQELNNFVILTTDGAFPPFVDYTQDASAFVASNNPHRTSLSPSVYDYARVDSTPSILAVGESVLIVNTDRVYPYMIGNLTLTGTIEWTFQNQHTTTRAGYVKDVGIRAKTSLVWNDYIDQLLEDFGVGIIATGDYSFATLRNFRFTVDSTVGYAQTIYTRKANAMNFLQDVNDFPFVISSQYLITGEPTVSDRVGELTTFLGVSFDTGVILIFLLVVVGIFFLLGLMGIVSAPLSLTVFVVAFLLLILFQLLSVWLGIALGVIALLVTFLSGVTNNRESQ